MQKNLGPARPFSDKLEILTFEEPLRCLTMANGLLLALTEEGGELVGRVGVSKTNQAGNMWMKVDSASQFRWVKCDNYYVLIRSTCHLCQKSN